MGPEPALESPGGVDDDAGAPLAVPGGNDVVESDDESLDGDDSDAESVVSGPGALNAVHESTSTRTTRQTVDLSPSSRSRSLSGRARRAMRPPAGL